MCKKVDSLELGDESVKRSTINLLTLNYQLLTLNLIKL